MCSNYCWRQSAVYFLPVQFNKWANPLTSSASLSSKKHVEPIDVNIHILNLASQEIMKHVSYNRVTGEVDVCTKKYINTDTDT